MSPLRRSSEGAPPRVVLDTNVVLSALVFSGMLTAPIRLAWMLRDVVPLVSAATVQELLRVLAYPKFRLTVDEQHELLADYLPYAETVRIDLLLETPPVCRDPFDAPFLQLALAGRADALVSGDKDLLNLRDRFVIEILSPSAFAARLRTVNAP